MTNAALDEAHRLGPKGNNPPSDMEIFAEKMMGIYTDTFAFAQKLLEAEDRIPTEVNDDVTSGKLGDMIKQITQCDKSLNAARTEEKELYLKGSRMVDGFFNQYREQLGKLKIKASEIQAAYLKRKADEEARIREEKAKEAREQAERELAEANRKAKEAEELRRQQKEESDRIAKEAADREQKIRDDAAAEKLKAQAEIDRLNKEKEDTEKVDAETKRKLREAEAKLKEVEKTERADLREVKAETREQEGAIAQIGAAAKAAEKSSDRLLDTAARTEKQADKLDRHADANAADMARTRGFEGSVSTVQTFWVGSLASRESLDLNALRAHFREDDLNFAITQFVKTGGRQLKGADIREESKATVR